MSNTNHSFFSKESQILGHPAGLFVLFFTEMWERFSFYGMRALLVLFLVSAVGIGGWDWPRENALALYGTYLALLYLTPIIGGQLADKYLGYRKAIIIGAVIMTLGHAAMAIETHKVFLYLGLFLLVIGTGFFKPNMTSFISVLYEKHPEKKDGAYTIFYMGVNAGAFLGIMLCGYLGENLGWSWGFGLAGIFMLLGLLQFILAHQIFGEVGLKPTEHDNEVEDENHIKILESRNPFTFIDKILISFVAITGLTWVINDPLSKITNYNLLEFGGNDFSSHIIITALIIFTILLIIRTLRYEKVTRDRMFAIMFIAFFIIFFWACFEQAGGSMSIFAKDYTNRVLSGNAAYIFNILDIIITVVPVAIISYVLYLLFRKTYQNYLASNLILVSCFLIIWGLIFWKIYYGFNTFSYEISIPKAENTVIRTTQDLSNGQEVYVVDVDKNNKNFKLIDNEKVAELPQILTAQVIQKKDNEIEIPATWFLILNSLFIILFAPLMSKWWESKYNPSLAGKYAIGLFLLGAGFAFLAFGSRDIPQGAKTASVSFIWLIMAYLLHTLGELCVQPVGLSYVSKLVPARMIAFMFGVWYLALAIGNKTSGKLGEMIDDITNKYDISTFFLIFTFIPVIIGILALLLHPVLKRLMHGVK
ncbi:Di-/tripeptide transporter [Candidatus Ornithobacterium hominis]|uniref:Di-/tripeptide transporter n=1 Tax=Candidatus Ornithobacterium hominis TaxID=2497989 RepID=A0A383TVI8_9FLAO|nr:peptide MFS transporter [Candidatus Ornithobacterium hominis]MCT7903836.1 peptide MFS transporter [Candidatus Ornithobacterium hominis]SZD71179.1 Di-/tripeptide transporter [Candidatus Ornithobacterium hominis]